MMSSGGEGGHTVYAQLRSNITNRKQKQYNLHRTTESSDSEARVTSGKASKNRSYNICIAFDSAPTHLAGKLCPSPYLTFIISSKFLQQISQCVSYLNEPLSRNHYLRPLH